MFLRGDDMPAPRTISFNPFSGKSRVVVPERKATREDWKTCDMPEMHVVAEFRMDLTPEQMDTLSWGHVPLEMEDKWFSYMENGRLHIHRSWTGFCIYIIEFCRDQGDDQPRPGRVHERRLGQGHGDARGTDRNVLGLGERPICRVDRRHRPDTRRQISRVSRRLFKI